MESVPRVVRATADEVERPLYFARDAAKLTLWSPVSRAEDAKVAKGFDPHFRSWLEKNGYDRNAFFDPQKPAYSRDGGGQPVIFVHGNSGSAEDAAALIPELEAKGLRPFAFSYGNADKLQASRQYDSELYVSELLDFIEAVSRYTGKKPHLVGHSMGNLLNFRSSFELAKGGMPLDKLVNVAAAPQGLWYDLGSSLNPVARVLTPAAAAFDPLRPLYSRVRSEGIPAREVTDVYGTGDALLNWSAGPTPHGTHHFALPKKGHFDALNQGARLIAGVLSDDVPPGAEWLTLVD